MFIKKISFIFLLCIIMLYLIIPDIILGETKNFKNEPADESTLTNNHSTQQLDTEALINLGIIYLKSENYSEAESKFRLAVDLSPENTEAHFCLGEVLGIQKKYKEAIVHFEKVITLKPNFPKALNDLASAYLEEKLYDKALESVKKALELDPNLMVARCTLGDIYIAIGEYEKALAEFEIAKNDPTRVGTYAQRRINEIGNKIKEGIF